MAAYKSDQRTNVTASPPTMLKANEKGGRVRQAFFSFTTPSGGLALADTVELVTLPKGARVLGGAGAAEAMSTSTGTAGADIGVAGTAAKYGSAVDLDAAGAFTFADTVVRNYGEELSADATVIATVVGEAWAGSKKLQGHVLYVQD